MFFLRYLKELFIKTDPSGPKSINLTIMHNINRVAIIMFLIALIIVLIKNL